MKSLVCIGILLSLTACLGPVPELYPPGGEETPVTVYLTGHGWHTGIVAEAVRVSECLPPVPGLPDTRYLEFGWGDAAYYPDPEAGVLTLFSAALLPTPAVMHIAGFDRPPAERFPDSRIVGLEISGKGMQALACHLGGTIRENADGEAVVQGEGLYGDSLFVDAHGPYILPFTSNYWAAGALRAAGLPITPAYALSQGNVFYQAERAVR